MSTFSIALAGEDPGSFVLIPEAKDDSWKTDVVDLGENKKQNFWQKYNSVADKYSAKKDVGAQIASGIMNRDTIFLLLAQLVKALSNMALVIGAAMIIYAGYLYISSVYTGDNAAKANGAIKWAVIGIVVVIFSYAIIRILVAAFL